MSVISRLFSSTLIACTIPLLSGCVENRSSLYVEGVGLAEVNGDVCEVALPLEDFRGKGFYDYAAGTGYSEFLVVGNQLSPVGDNDTLRTETSRIQIEGAEIRIETIDGPAPQRSAYTVTRSFTVNPVDSPEAGRAAFEMELIPPDNITEDGTYLLNIIFFGRTLGGTPIESGEWAWEVTARAYNYLVCPVDGEPIATCLVGSYFADCSWYNTPTFDACAQFCAIQ